MLAHVAQTLPSQAHLLVRMVKRIMRMVKRSMRMRMVAILCGGW